MQQTWAWSLIQEDRAHCCGATKPVLQRQSPCVRAGGHDCWAHTHVSCDKRSLCKEKPMHPNKEEALLTAAAENQAEQEKKKCSPKQINKTCTKEYAWEGKYFTAWTFVLVKVIECRYDWQITLQKHLSFLLTLGFLVDHQLVWPQKWGHKTCQTWWRKTCVFEI